MSQAYPRAHLGLSLGKANDLFEQFMGLSQSRVAAMGQLCRMGDRFDPVVQKRFLILRDEPVVHADETSWSINGKNVFFVTRVGVDRSPSFLGDRFEGVLVTDFDAASGCGPAEVPHASAA